MNLDISVAFQYKKQVASKLIPVKGDSISELIPESSEYFLSEKIDGFLCLVAYDGVETCFYDQSGTQLNLPHLIDAFPKDAIGIWAGELYVEGRRSRSFIVASALANEPTSLSLLIFDCVDNSKHSIYERYESVKNYFTNSGKIQAIEIEQVSSRKSIVHKFDSIVESGGEGIVVYTSSGLGYKVKPLQYIDCVVMGYAERESKQEIRELLIGLATENGYLVIGKVGTGFTEVDRKEWYERLEKVKVDSNILEIAGNGLAFNWVKPEIVVEISYQELIYETVSSIIRKDEIVFLDNKYSILKQAQSFSLIHPVFIQMRLDKKVIVDHCGLSQISFDGKNLHLNNTDQERPAEAICIDRQVYIKSSKSGRALRKITLWKSPIDDKKRSPFIIYYTDFSPGRKEPLQTEIYLANNEKSAHKRFLNLFEENIKKGWEKV
jgi:hypothetical protein